jgi:hypothetical protein
VQRKLPQVYTLNALNKLVIFLRFLLGEFPVITKIRLVFITFSLSRCRSREGKNTARITNTHWGSSTIFSRKQFRGTLRLAACETVIQSINIKYIPGKQLTRPYYTIGETIHQYCPIPSILSMTVCGLTTSSKVYIKKKANIIANIFY